MAFSTSNVTRQNGGSMNIMTGNWTGSAGDTAGSVTGSGNAATAEFDSNLSTGPGESIIPRIVNSSGTWTVTVPYSQAVTAGTFRISFK